MFSLPLAPSLFRTLFHPVHLCPTLFVQNSTRTRCKLTSAQTSCGTHLLERGRRMELFAKGDALRQLLYD